MVGGDCTVVLEELATVLHRGDIAVVVTGINSGYLSQPVNIGVPVGLTRLEVLVGAEGRDHAPLPGLVIAKELVGGQIVARVVGSRDHLDLELLMQRPRLELRRGETVGDLVIDLVSGFGARPHRDPEGLTQLRLKPEPHRSAVIGAPVRTQGAEGVA